MNICFRNSDQTFRIWILTLEVKILQNYSSAHDKLPVDLNPQYLTPILL